MKSLTNQLETLKSLEMKLLNPFVRESRDTLDMLLHDDFEEIGASGRIYNKQDILKSLPNQQERVFNASGFFVHQLTNDVYLLRYTLIESGETSVRTSIWKNENNQYKIVFHQGTITS